MSEALTRRILTVRGGKIEPLIPRSPQQSSEDTWEGVMLEKHLADADYVRTNFEAHSHLVHVFGSVPVRQEWRIEGRNVCLENAPGSVLIEPKGLQVSSVHASRQRPDVQWIVEFTSGGIENCLEGKPFEPAPQFDLRDPQITHLLKILQAEVDSGCPGGSLFGETIGNSLMIYLAHRYSSSSISQPRGGLPKLRLNRVLDYIESNLDCEIHLEELAKVSGLSPFHFAKLFKHSTAQSPHQYVLSRRLELAKNLLRNPDVPLSEVGLRAGFSDQSHLTNVFRRFVGTTPSRFRSLL